MRHVQISRPGDAGRHGQGLVALAERANPALTRDHAHGGPPPPAGLNRALPSPPPGIPALTYRDNPAAARRFARDRAAAAGLTDPKLTDLVIAVGELAANTLRHTEGHGTLRLWAAAGEVICEVRDSGHIRDDRAGYRYPAADAGRGHGLWVVHQVCDLVEMRTGIGGTVFRLHLAL